MCADCVDYAFYVCRPFRDACMAAFCSEAPSWLCGVGEPDCSSASIVSATSCSVAGCVPGYVSSVGDPDPSTAVCVSIQSGTCVATCERVDPPCPTGTVPERDGFCFTDRCVPAFVCD
jgi:hypothetical protein